MKPARHKIWGSHLRFVIYVYRSVDKIFQGGVQFAEIFTNHGHPHFKKNHTNYSLNYEGIFYTVAYKRVAS